MDTATNKPTYQDYAAKIAKLKNGQTSQPAIHTGSAEKLASASRPRSEGCPDCGGQGFVGYDVSPGHRLFGRLKPCKNDAYHGGERLQRLAGLSGLGAKALQRRLDDITILKDGSNKPMLAAARQMLNNPTGWLYIWGGPGNAKTVVLIALVNELNESGRGPAVYLKLSRLINLMREAYAEKNNRRQQVSQGARQDGLENLGYLDRFEKIKNIPFLAIDEFDKARMTEFAEEFRFDFFDDRYMQAEDDETVTVVASNNSPVVLPDPLKSRFSQFPVVHNAAGDARENMGTPTDERPEATE